MGLDYNRLVVGYHGTDAKVARRALNGHTMQQSENDYDWLGHGIYFWEQGPNRAMDFAIEMNALGLSDIRKPSVIGAYINLGDCLDLLDVENTSLLSDFHRIFRSRFKGLKNAKPRGDRTKLFHNLDCAVINSLIEFLREYETGRLIRSGDVFGRGTQFTKGRRSWKNRTYK